MNTMKIPTDVIDVELQVFPDFVPDLPEIIVCVGQDFKHRFHVGAPRTSMTNFGSVVPVAEFLLAIEEALHRPLEESRWEALSVLEKAALILNMSARLSITYPRLIDEFRGKRLHGSIRKASVVNAIEAFARDPRNGKLRVIGMDYLRGDPMFDGISWDNATNEFLVHTREPPPSGC